MHRLQRRRVTPSLDDVIRVEGGQVLATLIRLTGDIDAAEDAFQDAVLTATEVWPRDGIPDKPGAWLTTKLLIWLIERQIRPREGLYAWSDVTGAAKTSNPAPASLTSVDARTPLLLFLHGTASNKAGAPAPGGVRLRVTGEARHANIVVRHPRKRRWWWPWYRK